VARAADGQEFRETLDNGEKNSFQVDHEWNSTPGWTYEALVFHKKGGKCNACMSPILLVLLLVLLLVIVIVIQDNAG
jgi:hypothetical protein